MSQIANSSYVSQCVFCRHFSSDIEDARNCCAAFPDSIPKDVFRNKISHMSPIDGDRGIRFEPRDDDELLGEIGREMIEEWREKNGVKG